MALTYKNIAPFLATGQHKWSRWLSYAGLGVGVLLLLCCLQMYININALLKEKSPRKNGFDYIAVTKIISNQNMGQDHSFSAADMELIKKQPSIQAAAPLLANQFLVKASGGSLLPFSTDLFLEAIDNSFLDTLPADFTWHPGQNIVPIIISSDYLELYNTVFAPSQDLPQFSAQSISSVMIQLQCFGASGNVQSFRGNIVGLSDRINSVLVPINFLQWANNQLGSKQPVNPSRVFIKTTDANSTALLNFLQLNNFHVNKDKTKFGRVKQVLQAIVTGLSGFGLLVIALAMMLFSFYLQLIIAKSKHHLQLLLLLGYSPAWLSKTLVKKWIPVYAIIILSALAITALLHWGFRQLSINAQNELGFTIHWLVAMLALVLLALAAFINHKLVSKQLRHL